MQRQGIKATASNYAYTNMTQYPQQGCTWCGVAASESVLSSWAKYSSQTDIANKEYGYMGLSVPSVSDCNASGVSESAIAYALNGYIFNQWSTSYWYKICHFYSMQDLINLLSADIGADTAGVVFCGYTEYLPAWNGHHAVHYTAVYGYNLDSSNLGNPTIFYTDSANGLYIYLGIKTSSDGLVNYSMLPAYNSCHLNYSSRDSYYQYAYPYPGVG
ncbi:C39 family peptidase [Caldisericum exile]|uniref:Peptidase C39-like domain-containing protein n=1 Tax=Caldisericum exile (strain DSM 21853 / NBRC 104410 / AZM16c01) TaxID=511051 RepID=A0A7U6GD79_CALEA|nr:C39 family peptidase [Caldisericum exile]BAL80191.1 hypothetical protein CSE_00650 [Caldisericum exile AZM16c01]